MCRSEATTDGVPSALERLFEGGADPVLPVPATEPDANSAPSPGEGDD